MIHRSLATIALGGALVLALTACGTTSTGAAAPASQLPSRSSGARGGPAASGKIAAVDPSDIQVQNNGGQVTVKFSGSTTFTNQVSGTLADVTQGSCVIVAGTGTPIVARTVAITAAGGDSCALGGGLRPQNGGGGRSSGSTAPRPSGGNRNGGRAAGKVTAVTSTGFTVQEDNRQTGATTDVQVTVDAGTTYTKSASADASALKVGECVAANGQTDDTGAVTARTIAISQAGPNGCADGRQRNGNGNGNG